jgi:GAF domain-containing protein
MTDKFLAAGFGRLVDPRVHADLLRSTVRLTRLVFGAAAASIFLYDPARDVLVFEAASGRGEDRIVGTTIPPDHGVAGWVFQTGETMVLNDLASDTRFDRTLAESTGYVPEAIVAAPLTLDEPLGVLEVLDAAPGRFDDLGAMEVLSELAEHLAASMSLLQAARTVQKTVDSQPHREPWIRLEQTLTRTRARESAVVRQFVHALDDLIATRNGDGR